MGLVIGMDEAGYGPNLGPLVVTATVWETPGHPREADFWTAMDEVVSQTRPDGNHLVHVADSKEVHNASQGIGSLEKGIFCLLGLRDTQPRSFRELCQSLTNGASAEDLSDPWYKDCDLSLPLSVSADSCRSLIERWNDCCRNYGIRLRNVLCDIVHPARFNRLTAEFDSKGVALSKLSLQLLRKVWNPDDDEPTLVVADKHGGRNRYDGLLSEVLDGRLVFRGKERRQKSCYRVGSTEIRFQMKAEDHLPVAAASMISKYVRELAMELFNRFWREHLPELKPTKGYPVDARRFREEIAAIQTELEIPDDILWRER